MAKFGPKGPNLRQNLNPRIPLGAAGVPKVTAAAATYGLIYRCETAVKPHLLRYHHVISKQRGLGSASPAGSVLCQ